MARKYPNAYVEIDVFMNSLLEQWNATFGAKKDRARASSALKEEAKAPYFLDKTVIFPQSIKKLASPKRAIKKKKQNLLIAICARQTAIDITLATAAFF